MQPHLLRVRGCKKTIQGLQKRRFRGCSTEPTTGARALTLVSDDELPTPRDRFEEWWSAYPRKTAKGAARKAWATAVKKTTPDILIAALLEQRSTLAMDLRPEGDFRPHPSTWLNAERWADELEPQAPTDRAWKVSAPAPDFGPVCGECERPAGRHYTKCSRWEAGA